MHAFRTFLGDDEDFSNFVRWSVAGFLYLRFFFFVCLWPGCIVGLWRVVPCSSHWSALAILVGGRVACPVVVLAIIRGTWFSALDFNSHQSVIQVGS